MTQRGTVRRALKRGALLTAANWQIVAVQAVADSISKLLIAIPVIGGAILVALLVEADLSELLAGDIRIAAATVASALSTRPAALTAFALAFLTVLVGGAALTLLAKAGSVSVIVAADRAAGPIERSPLRLAYFQRAMQFSIEDFSAGATALFRRFLVLGLWLMVVYGVTGGLYIMAAFGGYRLLVPSTPVVVWTALAVLGLLLVSAWIVLVNLIYAVTQVVMAVTAKGPVAALGAALSFMRVQRRKVARAFGVVLLLFVLATGLSLLAIAGLGLIAFVPIAGLAVIPIQLGAAFLRSLLFQFLGLTALGAYLGLYRSRETPTGTADPFPDFSYIDEPSS